MKGLIAFILFFCTVQIGLAKIEVNVGGKAGMNLAHIRKIENPDGFKNKINLGSNFGGIIRLNFNKNIGVQTEILFTQKGQRWLSKNDSTKNYIRFVNNYIEVPLLAVASFGSEKTKAIIYLGTYFGYWAGAYTQTSTQEEKRTIAKSNNEYTFSNFDNRFDAGIASGVGVNFKLGKGYLELAARHNLGLVNRTTDKNFKQYNCNFNFSIAYLFKVTNE
jgi:hypothetical protein